MGLASSIIRSAVRSLPSKKPEGIMSKDKITGKIKVTKAEKKWFDKDKLTMLHLGNLQLLNLYCLWIQIVSY